MTHLQVGERQKLAGFCLQNPPLVQYDGGTKAGTYIPHNWRAY
jgi:hypothetical protein